MKVIIYPKHLLEAKWSEDKKLYHNGETGTPPLCLRCGNPLSTHLAVNALSRYVDVDICDTCGTDEALRDYTGAVIPLSEWHALTHSTVTLPHDAETAVLFKTCSFRQVFEEPRREVWGHPNGYPMSQLCYSRSDYNGSRWYTTWFDCDKKPEDQALRKEIDDFQNALLELPEFKDLYTMADMCDKYAEHTDERTEFNLYSETAHFHIWLRMITRAKDYNLYVNFYVKASEKAK